MIQVGPYITIWINQFVEEGSIHMSKHKTELEKGKKAEELKVASASVCEVLSFFSPLCIDYNHSRLVTCQHAVLITQICVAI